MMPDPLRRCALAVILGLGLAALPASAAKPDEQKTTRTMFGSSLKRLKWHKTKQAAVEEPVKADGKKPKENTDADAAINLKTLLVTFDVLVTDASHAHVIEGLGKDDFVVSEDDQPQFVATFARGDDTIVPRSIILLLDWSGSQKPFIETSIAAAKVLINQLNPDDEMAIVTDDIDLVCDYTRDKAKLMAALEKIDKRAHDPSLHSRSWQFSALYAALRELISEVQRRPIIIFQTDGDQAVTFRDQPDA